MVQYKIQQLVCLIIPLLLGKICAITMIEVQDNYTFHANHKMLIFFKFKMYPQKTSLLILLSALTCKPNTSSSCKQTLTLVLKLVFSIFLKFLFFHQIIALQNLWKMFFSSSKKLFSFSRYSNFCLFFSSFPHFPDSKGKMEVE